jgi:hypothetical protein
VCDPNAHILKVTHSQGPDTFKCESEVNITKEQGVGARSLARSTFGVEGCAGASG